LTINEVPFTFSLYRTVRTYGPHWGMTMEKAVDAGRQGQQSELPDYEKPSIRMMDEKEVLSAFQVTVSGITWWVM
jgi:hypothetical protein